MSRRFIIQTADQVTCLCRIARKEITLKELGKDIGLFNDHIVAFEVVFQATSCFDVNEIIYRTRLS
jgi:hypothetical protein